VHPRFHRLPGPLRQQVTGRQPLHRLAERVVIPLLMAPGIFRPGRGGQRVQHRPDDRRAFRAEITGQDPGAAERGLQPHRAVVEVPGRVLIGKAGPGPLVHLPGELGQVPQPHPGGRRGEQDLLGRLTGVFGQLVGPLADGPAVGFGDLPGGHRGQHQAVPDRAAGPRGVRRGRAPGDLRVVHQPGPRAVVRVRTVALGRGEPGQDGGPCRGQDRVGLLQPAQVPGLLVGGHRGGVGGSQVAQPRVHHVQRLVGAAEGRDSPHPDHLLPGVLASRQFTVVAGLAENSSLPALL